MEGLLSPLRQAASFPQLSSPNSQLPISEESSFHRHVLNIYIYRERDGKKAPKLIGGGMEFKNRKRIKKMIFRAILGKKGSNLINIETTNEELNMTSNYWRLIIINILLRLEISTESNTIIRKEGTTSKGKLL